MPTLADAGVLLADAGGYHHSMGWGWFMMIGFWLLVIVAVVAAVGSTRRDHRPAPLTASGILAERFARGEIDDGEYHQRLSTLDRQ